MCLAIPSPPLAWVGPGAAADGGAPADRAACVGGSGGGGGRSSAIAELLRLTRGELKFSSSSSSTCIVCWRAGCVVGQQVALYADSVDCAVLVGPVVKRKTAFVGVLCWPSSIILGQCW